MFHRIREFGRIKEKRAIKEQALKHIKRCDNLFDGKHEDGTPSTLPPDREFAYNQMRLLALELLEKVVE